jgi:CubicO group peptidase (beta-lactamase class C family)
MLDPAQRSSSVVACLLCARVFAAHAGEPAPRGIYFPPPGEEIANQSRQAPGDVGLSRDVVAQLKAAIPKGRWALWRHGYLVHVEGPFNGNTEVKSLRKTWHALAVGAAIKQGRIPSLQQKISVWNKELRGLHAEATWWHVITQSSGFDYPCGDYPAYRPGEMWTYSDKNPTHLCNALARVYGKRDYRDHYDEVIRHAYFDAIGLRGWKATPSADGIRFHFDLEDMGRLGLLVVARGQWRGIEVIPRSFVEELETKQTKGMRVNYDGPDDGRVGLDPKAFPEAPYGFMTWVNTDGDYYPGADTAWAWGAGAGGTIILWNHKTGIVFAGVGVDTGPKAKGIPHVIESAITGANPLVTPQNPEAQ